MTLPKNAAPEQFYSFEPHGTGLVILSACAGLQSKKQRWPDLKRVFTPIAATFTKSQPPAAPDNGSGTRAPPSFMLYL